jgi:hypothetical protein
VDESFIMMYDNVHHDERAVSMSRTTVDLDPAVIRRLKLIGANAGESMSRVINRLLREALKDQPARRQEEATFSWRIVEGGRPAAGFDPSSREYLDLIEHEQ